MVVQDFAYRTKRHLQRWRLGWRYATGRLTAEDAQTMTVELQPIAGWWPIKTLAVEDVVGPLTFPDGEYEDNAAFREIVALACEEVHAYWEEGHDDIWEAAERKVDELVRARAEVSL